MCDCLLNRHVSCECSYFKKGSTMLSGRRKCIYWM